jgi:hypothetical protein
MSEKCVCGHDRRDHSTDFSDGMCEGDRGECSCQAFRAPPATPAVSREERKIVQVEIDDDTIIVLATDGTIWWSNFAPLPTWRWKQLPPLPLTRPRAPTEATK